MEFYDFPYISYDEVRLDPHQAFPHYQFFSFISLLLFHFFPYLYLLLTTTRLTKRPSQLRFWQRLDAQVWMGCPSLGWFWESSCSSAAIETYAHVMNMKQFGKCHEGCATTALPLEIFVWRFHFSPSCFQLAGLNMPCKFGNDWHPELQDISWLSGRRVQFLSDTKHRLLLELNQIDMQSVCIYCTILIPLKFQNSLRSSDGSGGSNDKLPHTLW